MNFLSRALHRLVEKTVIATFNTQLHGEWLQDNGYSRLASDYGFSRDVTHQRALQATSVFGCVKIIGEDAGSLPLPVLRRLDSGGSEKATDYPLYELLHDQTNPEQTAMEFREALTAHAALCGVAYARIVRESSGKIIALWPLMPYAVTEKRNQNGGLYYEVTENGKTKQYADSDIFRLRNFGIEGNAGLNMLTVAQRTIGLTLQQVDYAAKFFKNDHTPGIVLEHPGRPGAEGLAGIKKAWKDQTQSHDVAVTQEGLKVTRLGQTNTDAQLVEQRTFQIAEVCRLFRMPPHKLQELSRATFSNIEHLNRQYYTETLRPWLVRWEQAIRRCLIPKQDQQTYYAEHTVEGFLRGDFKTQTDGFAKLLEKGVVSINEVREFLNFNPIEDGDKHYVQLNMQAVGEEPEPEPAEPAQIPAEPPKLRRVKGMLWK